MCSYLVYPSFPLIGVVGAVSLVINLPVASGFKAQKFTPGGAVRSIVLVALEVIWVALLPERLLAWG